MSYRSAIIILCCGFFVLGCHAATEKTFHSLSHGMLFLAVASSVTDLNYLLNRAVDCGSGDFGPPKILMGCDSRLELPPGWFCYVLFRNCSPKSLGARAGRARKENQSPLLRDVAQANT